MKNTEKAGMDEGKMLRGPRRKMSKTDGIIAKAYGVTAIEKWEAPKPDWQTWRKHAEALASKIDNIAKIAYNHEAQYWLDDPRSDKEKLAAILGEARDALGDFKAFLKYGD